MTDEVFPERFHRQAISYEEWTHEAHVRLAFLTLKAHPPKEALLKVREGIQRLNAIIGVTGRGYHETITQAFLRLVGARLEQGETWEVFKEKHPDLMTSWILARYYSLKRLDLPEAKAYFLEPDLLELPVWALV